MIQQLRVSRSAWYLPIVDYIIILTCYLSAYLFRHVPNDEFALVLHYVPWLGFFSIVTYYLFNLYNFSGRMDSTKYYYNLVLSHTIIAVELIVLNYGFNTFILPRNVVIIAVVLQFIVLLIHRVLLLEMQLIRNKKRALIIVHEPNKDVSIVEKVLNKGQRWFEIHAVIPAGESSLMLELSSPDIELFILSPNIDPLIKAEILRFAGKNRKEVLIIPEFYDLSLMGAELQQIDDMLVYSIQPPNLSPAEQLVKRGIDLFVSIGLLVLTSPILLLCFLLIPLTSNGKALFRQERIGVDEKPFLVLKFRSMIDNAEVSTGPVLALDHDVRITSLGKFMRATRIDELPQLINVIRGEMSIVGPRPERDFFIHKFRKDMPHYSYRFMVKPGITGLAQVMGSYSTLPADKLSYDLMYIRNYRPMLDVRIMIQTLLVVLRREQAKGITAEVLPMESNGSKGRLRRMVRSKKDVAVSKE